MISRWLLAIVLLLSAAPALAADDGRFVEREVSSSAFGPIKLTVWLPPRYDTEPRRRYPVVYMQDSQNLFFPARSNFNKVWAADKAALALIRAGRVAPFIIVGIDHPGKERYQRYFPVRVPEATLRAGIEGFAGKLQGDGYVAFMADELKPLIDRDYRTRPEPRFNAVAGSSMGGLISLYALAERPDAFGRAAAVSTHSPLIGPDNIAKAPGLQPTIQGSWRTYLHARLGAPRGRKLWMDHGTATLDQHYAPYQQIIDGEIRRLGWTDRQFASRVYDGAEHEENAWAKRLPEIFAWLLSDWKP